MMLFFSFLFSKHDRHTYQVGKKKREWVCQRLVCQKREFTVRSSSAVKFQDEKFKDPKICQKLIHRNFRLTNLTLYMHLFKEIS